MLMYLCHCKSEELVAKEYEVNDISELVIRHFCIVNAKWAEGNGVEGVIANTSIIIF